MKKTLLVLLVLVIAAITYFLLSGNEASKICKQVQQLSEAVSKKTGEGNASMTVKMLTLGRLLGEEVDVQLVDFPGNGTQSSEMLVSLATNGRNFFQEIQITPLNIEVAFPDKTEASATCTVRVFLSTSDKNYNEKRTFQSKLRKIDGSWKFFSFQETELLRK